MADDLAERRGPEDLEVVDHGGLGGIGGGKYESFQPHLARQYRHWQHPLYRQQRAVERQFPHYHVFPEPLGGELLVGGENPYGEGQVVGSPLLLDLGGSHVDKYLAAREVKPAVADSRLHPLYALLDRFVGHSDQRNRETRLNESLYRDVYGVDTLQGRAADLYEHCV